MAAEWLIPDEVRELRDRTRRFVREELVPAETPHNAGEGLPEDIVARLQPRARAEGLWCFTTPRGFGGMGLSPLGLAVITEEAVQHTFSMPDPGRTVPCADRPVLVPEGCGLGGRHAVVRSSRAMATHRPPEGGRLMALETNRVDILAAAWSNDAFRREILTGEHEQVVVMTIPPGGEIGDEVHSGTDQLLSIIDGRGEAQLDGQSSEVGPNDLVFVRAGTRHNFRNTGDGPLHDHDLRAAGAPRGHGASGQGRGGSGRALTLILAEPGLSAGGASPCSRAIDRTFQG